MSDVVSMLLGIVFLCLPPFFHFRSRIKDFAVLSVIIFSYQDAKSNLSTLLKSALVSIFIFYLCI